MRYFVYFQNHPFGNSKRNTSASLSGYSIKVGRENLTPKDTWQYMITVGLRKKFLTRSDTKTKEYRIKYRAIIVQNLNKSK